MLQDQVKLALFDLLIDYSCICSQNSYASHGDAEVGQSVIDRYSKSIKDFVDDAVAMAPSQSDVRGTSFDSSTVAVMERLNAFDALVRVPTMHGESSFRPTAKTFAFFHNESPRQVNSASPQRWDTPVGCARGG